VTGLYSQDGASGGQVGGGHDVGCGTEVGADTNSLEDGGGNNEALDIGDTERVHALSDGLGTSLGESGSQESNMGGFIG